MIMLGLRMETIRFYDLKKLTDFLNILYVEKEITVKIYLSGSQIFERETKETVWVLKNMQEDFVFVASKTNGNILGMSGNNFSYYELQQDEDNYDEYYIDYYGDLKNKRILPPVLYDFENNINILTNLKNAIKCNHETCRLLINRSFDDDRMRLLSHILKLEGEFQKNQNNYTKYIDSFEIGGCSEHPELMDISKEDEIKLVINGKEYDVGHIGVFNR